MLSSSLSPSVFIQTNQYCMDLASIYNKMGRFILGFFLIDGEGKEENVEFSFYRV